MCHRHINEQLMQELQDFNIMIFATIPYHTWLFLKLVLFIYYQIYFEGLAGGALESEFGLTLQLFCLLSYVDGYTLVFSVCQNFVQAEDAQLENARARCIFSCIICVISRFKYPCNASAFKHVHFCYSWQFQISLKGMEH